MLVPVVSRRGGAKMQIRLLRWCSGLLLLLSSLQPLVSSLGVRRYESIFSFGDSFADTGNNPVAFGWYSIFDPVMRPPYGSTFFGRPTGRNCDGRLAIDFIAESMGLPLVPPFLAHNGSFRAGANFAVGGSTALDASFFHDGELHASDDAAALAFNISLNVQLQWFESLKPSLCATAKECRDFFGTSLFFVGEFGFNDYTISLFKKSVQEVRLLVPDVIRTISMAIERLIQHGATSLVVPGMPPAGCAPPVLVLLDGDTDEVNELAIHHNSLLLESLEKIRAQHPEVEIIYADFFRPVMEMFESPAKFGFDGDVLTVCCGGPGKYHFNQAILCGDPSATKCKDPSARLFWDGAHFTEVTNRYIAADWLSSISKPASASTR